MRFVNSPSVPPLTLPPSLPLPSRHLTCHFKSLTSSTLALTLLPCFLASCPSCPSPPLFSITSPPHFATPSPPTSSPPPEHSPGTTPPSSAAASAATPEIPYTGLSPPLPPSLPPWPAPTYYYRFLPPSLPPLLAASVAARDRKGKRRLGPLCLPPARSQGLPTRRKRKKGGRKENFEVFVAAAAAGDDAR